MYPAEHSLNSAKARMISGKKSAPILFLFLGGSLFNVLSYSSLEPLLAAIIFFSTGIVLLNFKIIGGRHERSMFIQVFSVCWFMAGIAAVYVNFLHDFQQLRADEAHFFWRATSDTFRGVGLVDLSHLTEGSGAVLVWRIVYRGFAFLGFEKSPYIGVLVNIICVSFSGVIAVKMARLIYGNDSSRLDRLKLLFSFCGLFWLFAALHIRDAFVLLTITSLTYVWTLYLTQTGPRNLILLIVTTLIVTSFIGYLRKEFAFVPFAMFFAGLSAISMFQKARGFRMLFSHISALFGFFIAVFLLPGLLSELMPVLADQSSAYFTSAADQAEADSLGMSLIMKQPLPIRVGLASVWLFIFPIPFWSGFQLETAYHLFKSFNVIFFYFLTPLFLLSIWRIIHFKKLRTPAIIFNLYVILGFTLTIAGTSVETRHFGVFIVPLLMVSLLPNLEFKSERIAFKNILVPFLSGIFMIHFVWTILKFF